MKSRLSWLEGSWLRLDRERRREGDDWNFIILRAADEIEMCYYEP